MSPAEVQAGNRVPAFSRGTGLRLFIFFALGYFVSYLFRGVNVGFSPYLVTELGLTAADLGLLTGVYFLAFSAVQIPAGILIDTYGPARVNAVMMTIAAVGTVVFGLAEGLAGLLVGRALVGIGVSVCLGSALKALAQVFPLSRLPLINGLVMAVGGMGGVFVGTPLIWLLEWTDWRSVSVSLAFLTVVVAAMIWFGGRSPIALPRQRPSLVEQWRGTLQIMTDASFWQLASLSVVTGGVFYAVQSLWVAPFLQEVGGHTATSSAALVSMLGAAMVGGNILLGWMARYMERLGVSLYWFSGICMVLYLLVQLLVLLRLPLPDWALWCAYGVFGSSSILSYAVMAGFFPYHMLGRVSTTVTLLMFLTIFLFQAGIGWVVALWPAAADGTYPPAAHVTAWSVLLAIQVAGAIWYFWPTATRRRL